MKKTGAPLFMIWVALFLGCQANPGGPYEERADIMGTTFTIKIDAPAGSVRPAARTAFQEIRRIDRLLSTYKPDSEISDVNRRAFTEAVAVGEDFWHVVMASRKYFTLSGGSFDPSIRPLMQAWSLTAKQGRLPTEEELKKALDLVDFGNVRLDESTHTVAFAREEMALDFGGIAKGYAVDRAIAVLESCGVTSAIVDAGGNFRAIGAPRNRDRWQIGIRHPLRHDEIIARLPISEGAAATSGGYERFFEVEGKRYCHIMDPRTGQPVQAILSATVLAKSAMAADALSTSVFVLGADEGMRLIEETPDVEGMLILPGESYSAEDFRLLISSGLRDEIELLFPTPS